MNPIKHPSNNDQLKPPAGVSEDDCRTLDITRLQQNVGGEILPVVVSFWRPEPAELAALNAGMPLFLHFWGRTHPPVSVGVEARPTDAQAEPVEARSQLDPNELLASLTALLNDPAVVEAAKPADIGRALCAVRGI